MPIIQKDKDVQLFRRYTYPSGKVRYIPVEILKESDLKSIRLDHTPPAMTQPQLITQSQPVIKVLKHE